MHSLRKDHTNDLLSLLHRYKTVAVRTLSFFKPLAAAKWCTKTLHAPKFSLVLRLQNPGRLTSLAVCFAPLRARQGWSKGNHCWIVMLRGSKGDSGSSRPSGSWTPKCRSSPRTVSSPPGSWASSQESKFLLISVYGQKYSCFNFTRLYRSIK